MHMWSQIATFLAVLMVPHMTLAATFVVDSTADEVDSVPGDGVCRSIIRKCTLRAAIIEANALAGADTIVLPAGTYRLVLPGVDEDAGYKGDLDITDDLIIQGAGEATTIVDGSRMDRVFDVHSSAHLTASDIAITHGEPPPEEDGGGMVNAGTISLQNVTFVQNHAGRGGGFVGGLDNPGTAVLTQVTFNRNYAGNICVDRFCYYAATAGDVGAMRNDGSATLASVTFHANRAADGVRGKGTDALDGGNIGAFANFGTATLTDVAFLGNRAGDGADGEHGVGGDCGAFWNEGDATLTRVSFTGNRAGDGGIHRSINPGYSEPGDGGGGGAVWNYGTMMLSDVNISRNRAGNAGRNGPSDGGDGGGIYNAGEATLNNVTLDRNRAGTGRSYYSAGSGGAILADGPMALTNVTITRNRAGNLAGRSYGSYGPGTGGGIAVAAEVTLTNVTLALNRCGKSSYGGRLACSGNQIDVGGPVQLTNTIVYGRGQSCSDVVDSLGHNIDSGTTCGLTAAGDLGNTNPRLDALKSNGGFSQTMKLRPGSPAIDAGDNGACPATDQRGVTRPQGAGCDIGAYEFP